MACAAFCDLPALQTNSRSAVVLPEVHVSKEQRPLLDSRLHMALQDNMCQGASKCLEVRDVQPLALASPMVACGKCKNLGRERIS